MIKCWAKETGLCNNIQSAEHLVSACYFKSKGVAVNGLPWVSESKKIIGKKSLTSNILCNYHNSALTLLDEEGGKISAFFRESHQIGFKIANKIGNGTLTVKQAKKIKPFRRLIKGHLFEKWLLKTGINFAHIYRPDYYIGNGTKKGFPSHNMLDVIFNNAKLINKQGLYFVRNIGAKLTEVETISFVDITDETTKRIIGFEFYIWGWRFFLSLTPENFVLDKEPITLANGLSNKNLKYRQSHIKGTITYKDGKHILLCSELKFKW